MLKIISVLANNDMFGIQKSLFGLATDIYITIAKIYSLLYDTTRSTSSFSYDSSISAKITSLATAMYVLAGVFMLFRVTISFLNMLIDPDKTNDKQVGAGSVIKRLAVSIVMLIAFSPNSIVFDYLERLENAILGTEDNPGLISNITNGVSVSSVQIDKDDLLLIDEVNAANMNQSDTGGNYKKKDCYYYRIDKSTSTQGVEKAIWLDKGNNIYKITITNSPYANGTKITYPGKPGATSSAVDFQWYVITHDGETETASDGTSVKLASFGYTQFELYNASDPARATYNGNSYKNGFLDANGQITCPTSIRKCKGGTTFKCFSEKETTPGLTGLSKSLDEVIDKLDERTSNVNVIETHSDENKSGFADADSALDFAQGTLRSFISLVDPPDKAEDAEKELEELTSTLLYNPSANQDIYELSIGNNPTIHIQNFFAILVGIVIGVYLAFLCVDVVVRNLKLLLLQVLAPIPIVSYIDPKDKVFNEWIKMYFSTYVDLFIKLLAISLSLDLLQILLREMKIASGWTKLFLIGGILIFAKAIPSILSKLFGIDISSGSFKEIGKLAKTGLHLGTAGVGAVVGLGIGAATGKGFGRVTGAFQGLLRGAGAGYKGDILGGGKQVAKRNYEVNQMKEEGLNFFDRALIASGIEVGDKKFKDQMTAASEVQKKNSALKNYAKEEIQKKGLSFVTTGAVKSKANPNVDLIAAGETIDMRTENNKLNDLQNTTAAEWIKGRQVTDSNGIVRAAKEEDYYEALSAQQDRVASLEDHAIAAKIQMGIQSKDAEMTRFVSEFNSSVSDANAVGLDGFKLVDANITSNTISDNKNTALNKITEIEDKNAKAIKRSKYTGNS